MTDTRTPQSQSAAYRAAALINKTGPIPRAELFAKVHFSHKPGNQKQMLDRAIASGWLEEIPAGVALTMFARSHFGDVEEPAAKYVGQVAEKRTVIPVYERPALSRKHIPSSRGNRDDVPEFSVRAPVSFRTLAGGI